MKGSIGRRMLGALVMGNLMSAASLAQSQNEVMGRNVATGARNAEMSGVVPKMRDPRTGKKMSGGQHRKHCITGHSRSRKAARRRSNKRR